MPKPSSPAGGPRTRLFLRGVSGPVAGFGRPGSGAVGRACLLAFLGLASCGEPPERPPESPPAEGRAPSDAEGSIATFNDPQKSHAERVEALRRLRLLRPRDPAAWRRAYDRVKDRLWAEASLADSLAMSDLELGAFIEAIGWLSDMKDPRARLKLELHLDRETVKRKRIPDLALAEVALALGRYPESQSARDTLWAAFRDPQERPLVRTSAMKALQAHHPSDLEARILEIPSGPGDDWLRDLQRKLR